MALFNNTNGNNKKKPTKTPEQSMGLTTGVIPKAPTASAPTPDSPLGLMNMPHIPFMAQQHKQAEEGDATGNTLSPQQRIKKKKPGSPPVPSNPI